MKKKKRERGGRERRRIRIEATNDSLLAYLSLFLLSLSLRSPSFFQSQAQKGDSDDRLGSSEPEEPAKNPAVGAPRAYPSRTKKRRTTATKEASKKKTSKLRWAASSEPPHLSAASVLRSSGPRAGPRRFPVVRSGEGDWRARESESESESEKIENTLGSVSNNVVDSHLFSSFSLLFF